MKTHMAKSHAQVFGPRRLFQAILILSAFITHLSVADTSQAVTTDMPLSTCRSLNSESKGQTSNPARAGADLRRELEERYQNLDKSKKLIPQGRGRNFVNDIVKQYIPIGINYDMAEEILRQGGFDIGSRERSYGPYMPGHFGQVNTLILRKMFFSNVHVVVFMQPESKDNWSTVCNIEADIVLSTL